MKLLLIDDCNDCPFNDVEVANVNEIMTYCPLISFPVEWKNSFDFNITKKIKEYEK